MYNKMSNPIPPEFECPILLTTMDDPVIGDDHQTYQRHAIVHWLSDPRNQGRSPITRAPMRIDSLRTNFALKSQIERFLAQAASVPQTPQPVPEAFIDQPLDLEATVTRDHISLTVKPPAEGERQPIVLFALLDNSGSTGENSGAELEKGAADYTILDLCKHTVRTLSGMLGPKDMLCLITYSSTAKVVLRPTFMNQAGQEKLDALLLPIKPEGNTNIWAALELMDRVASAPEFAGSNIVSTLLTDGMSNMNPGRGVVEMFRLYGKPSLYNLSTFGFGYNIDSKLLIEISNISGGAYVFCPDFSMVATAFINWTATHLSSAAKPKTVKVHFQDGAIATLSTGTIQFGQPRTFTLPLMGGTVTSVTMGEQTAVPVQGEAIPIMDMARYELVAALKEVLVADGSLEPIRGLCDKYRGTPADVLMAEIKEGGQVVLGTQKIATRGHESPWMRWGQHYIPAYAKAHELQQRMNFKDGGLQGYGSKNFETIQTLGDHIFGKVVPFEPTGTKKEQYISRGVMQSRGATQAAPLMNAAGAGGGGGGRAVTSSRFSPDPHFASPMAYLTTPGAGCWAAGCPIKMADGSLKPIEDVRKGDLVWTISGPAAVKYALKMGTKQAAQPMVRLGGCLITPWHPVKCGEGWSFPADIGTIEDLPVQQVYNLILESGHVVDIGGILTVCLGHGFTEPVVKHSFFGSEAAIIKAISQQPGFDEGRPVFENLKSSKYKDIIMGWYDDPYENYSPETAVDWQDLKEGVEYIHRMTAYAGGAFSRFIFDKISKSGDCIHARAKDARIGFAVGPWIEEELGGPKNRFWTAETRTPALFTVPQADWV
jgi:hypothetical protein